MSANVKRPLVVEMFARGVEVTGVDRQELARYALDLEQAAGSVIAGFTYDPGTSDLDDEQPIVVRMTLGEYRRLRALLEQKGGGR